MEYADLGDRTRTGEPYAFYGYSDGVFLLEEQAFQIALVGREIAAVQRTDVDQYPIQPIGVVRLKVVAETHRQILILQDFLVRHDWLRIGNRYDGRRDLNTGIVDFSELSPDKTWWKQDGSDTIGEREYGLLARQLGYDIELPSTRLKRESQKRIQVRKNEIDQAKRAAEELVRIQTETETETERHNHANPLWGQF